MNFGCIASAIIAGRVPDQHRAPADLREGRRRAWLVVLCLQILLALVLAGTAESAPEVYFSPNDDGVPGEPGLMLPTQGSTTLYLYVDGGEAASSSGVACASGNGDEVCAVDLKLRSIGDASITSFIPETDVIALSTETNLRLNSTMALTGLLGPVRLGALGVVTTAENASVALDPSLSVDASLQRVLIAERTLIPEPSALWLGTCAILAQGLLARRRARRKRVAKSTKVSRGSRLLAFACCMLLSLATWSAEAGIDTDRDGRSDFSDNCPFEFNPDQADVGGFDSSSPDGIGDACQCGDVNDDGTVDVIDIAHLERGINGLTPGLVNPFKCRVTVNGDCGTGDLAELQIALSGNSAGFQQACIAAGGLASCGDGQPDIGEQCDDGNEIEDDCCSSACIRLTGSCFIGGVCHADGTSNPSNACEECVANLDPDDWQVKDDGEICSDADVCTTGDMCSGGECVGDPIVDMNEPNDTLGAAADLGSVEDTADYPAGAVIGSLSPSGDEDWFRYHDEDTTLGSIGPRAHLSNVPSGRTYQICAFYDCDSGAGTVSCNDGTSATSNSLPGCCANSAAGTANVELNPDCTDTFDDSGDVFVRIDFVSGADSCDEYSLQWGDD